MRVMTHTGHTIFVYSLTKLQNPFLHCTMRGFESSLCTIVSTPRPSIPYKAKLSFYARPSPLLKATPSNTQKTVIILAKLCSCNDFTVCNQPVNTLRRLVILSRHMWQLLNLDPQSLQLCNSNIIRYHQSSYQTRNNKRDKWLWM